MNKLLPILLAATVYLTPLYPVYAQSPVLPGNRVKAAAASRAAEIKEAVEERREAMQDKAEAKMEEVREKIASRAAALKAKLAQFRDKNKALRVETVNQNLVNVNTKSVAHFQSVLEKISATLDRLKTKVSEAETEGKDVSAIKEAISDVEKEWTEADIAVKTQAAQDYGIVVSTEKNVKKDAMTTRNDLRQDLIETHTQVVEVRQALAKAVSTALSSLAGGNK